MAHQDKKKVERYLSAITILERNEEARQEQLAMMKALRPAGGWEAGPDLFVSFLCNSVDHMELACPKRVS